MSDELGSWVVALYTPPGSRPVHKFRLKAWAGFLRERGCLTVVPAEDLRRKATHVLLVDPPPCDDADADNRFGTYLGSMPASCVAGTSGQPPKILRQEWIYDSIREKRPMPTDAYEVTSRNPGQSMTRAPLTAVQPRAPAPVTCHNPPPPPKPSPDVQEILRAINDAKNDACLDACQASKDRDETSVDVGTLSGCLAAECAAAARSLKANPPASDLLTRTAFRAFRREGYPGFVGRTNVVEDVVEAALGNEWDSREKNALAAEDARWLRRRASRSDVTLLDLPDGVLGEVMERLCMRDALNAGAACRRLFRVAFGELKETTNEDKSLHRPRVCPAWPDRTGGVGTTRCMRVMTWNLKNNDPNPACRFMNQPGAGAEDGGWHWYSRLPIVARAIQRDKPGVVCLQEDLGCMAVELMCAREMRAAASTGDDLGTTSAEYECYPPPVRKIEDACIAAKSRRVLLSPSDTDPTCDPDDVDVLIADSLTTRARWEQNSVWWREDTYEAVDAGQFEWLDGRTRARFRGSVTPSNVNTSEMLAGSCIAFTWVLLRLKGDEHGGFGRVNRAWNERGGNRKFSSLDRRICVCSTHLEAGHDQNKDVPAKRNSAVCVRAAVRRLQSRHGPTVPVIVAGDFNMQKIQQHYRLLTGEGAGISRGLKNVTTVSPSRDFASRVPEGKGGDGGTNASTPTPRSSKKRTEREWDLAETNTDRACELVDVFDMFDRDNPDTTFDPKYLGIRSGGHNGTTWHGWKGPRHAEIFSHTIATHCKHNAQLGFWDPSERADGNGGGGGTGGGYRPPKKGRRDDFSNLSDFSGVGGGFSGQIGGVGRKTQKIGAVGHQRHIDHVFVAKGDGVRDDGRMDKQCRARCVRAFVRTDTSSENFRLPGESRCACGAFNTRYSSPAVRTRGGSRCTCDDVDGVWASDHFPVVADLRLSWSLGEGEPSSRELDSNGRRPSTP